MAFNFRGSANLGGISIGANIPDIGTSTTKKTAVTMSDIIARTHASFARPSLYKVIIANQKLKSNKDTLGKLNLNCYNASIPGLSIASTDKDIGYRSVAYQKLYDDVLFSFYCSHDLSELEYMQDWMKMISNPDDNRLGYYDHYVSDIHIFNLSKEGNSKGSEDNKKTLTTTLIDAYPKKIDPIQLDYASTDIMRLTVSFTYRYYKQIYGDKEISGRSPFLAKNLLAGQDKLDNGLIDHTLSKTERKDKFDGTVNESSDDLEF